MRDGGRKRKARDTSTYRLSDELENKVKETEAPAYYTKQSKKSVLIPPNTKRGMIPQVRSVVALKKAVIA